MDRIWEQFFIDFKSKADWNKASMFLLSENRLEESIVIMQKHTYPYSDWVTWIYTHFAAEYPVALQRYIHELVYEVQATQNHTFRRNLLKTLRFLKNQDDFPRFYDFILSVIGSPHELPAARVNAILLIEEWYLKVYPELIPEVQELIEISGYEESASLRAAKKNFQKFIKRINKA